ncbi:helicase carboxy-terminal domain [Brachionus plicatilis]|uniref:Helicase carboxy-terminal domain n=1 Tax=Brachionus plicatilis TaxID=10195 RepID=A0A3M7QWG9_BRAPC|nr:helicase carboxy-terminal domain [Brachionus plicatilis]
MTNSRSKTMVLMDATGSMGHLLNQVKYTICTMFDRAIDILTEYGFSSDSFEIQLAVYRDYDSLKNVLQTNEWERKPLNLRNFMNNIKANGGADYAEAIEIELWHVNQEIKRFKSGDGVSQVILIGDAPAKSIDSVKEYRKRFGGENFWSKTKFKVPTFYIDELNLLKESEVPVHAFFVENGPEECFSEIARITGGQTGFLDVNSSDGSDKLIDLITPLILGNIETINGNPGNQLSNIFFLLNLELDLRARFEPLYIHIAKIFNSSSNSTKDENFSFKAILVDMIKVVEKR